MSGFTALAQYKRRHISAGFHTLSSIARQAGLMLPGAMPELLNGDRYRPAERAVPHQLFSSAGVILPTVRGLMGIKQFQTDGKEGPRRLLVILQPAMPPNWSYMKFSRARIGGGWMNAEIHQQPSQTTLILTYEGKESVLLAVAPLVPPLAEIHQVLVDGKPQRLTRSRGGEENFAIVGVQLSKRTEVVVRYEGGIGIVPVSAQPEPGDRTTSLKILGLTDLSEASRNAAMISLAGLGGRTYTLDLVTSVPNLTAEGATVKKTENGYRLEIKFEGPETDYVTRQIRLRW
jgi:hypothetical protein